VGEVAHPDVVTVAVSGEAHDREPLVDQLKGGGSARANGQLIEEQVPMHALLVRDSLYEPGYFTFKIDSDEINELTGGEIRGTVTRFQVMDFQVLK
jgi:hypothetical protein